MGRSVPGHQRGGEGDDTAQQVGVGVGVEQGQRSQRWRLGRGQPWEVHIECAYYVAQAADIVLVYTLALRFCLMRAASACELDGERGSSARSDR